MKRPRCVGSVTWRRCAPPSYGSRRSLHCWDQLRLFDDGLDDAGPTLDRPYWLDLPCLSEARHRIRQQLSDHPDGLSLARRLLQAPDPIEGPDPTPVKQRSAWTSVFTASLEMAKRGEVRAWRKRKLLGPFTPAQGRDNLCRAACRQAGLTFQNFAKPSTIPVRLVRQAVGCRIWPAGKNDASCQACNCI